MADETYGPEGLELPVPGSNQRFNLARHWVGNFKKLSDRLKSTRQRTDELYLREYRSQNSQGETINSLGTVQTGWQILSWSVDTRGYVMVLSVKFKRTGADIKVPSHGDLGNHRIVLLQQRFRPISGAPMNSTYAGININGVADSSGYVQLTSSVPNQTLKKGWDFSLSGVFLSPTSGL